MNPTTPAVLLPAPCSEVKPAPAPRLRCADRQQLDLQPRLLNDLIEAEHWARVVWARAGGAQRDGCADFDGAVVVCDVEGVSSARQLAQVCQEHNAYRWLCGGCVG